MKRLNLGCGNDYKQGYVNLDKSNMVNPDIVWDIEVTPLPFKDNEFDEVYCSHILEHINNFIPLMHELHRITKEGGIINIRVPFYSAWGQFNDPTHVRFLTPWTFDYFNGGNWGHEVNSNKEMFKIKKKIVYVVGRLSFLNWVFNPLINLNPKFYCRFFAWTFPASELEFNMGVIK